MKRRLLSLILCLTVLTLTGIRADEVYNPTPTGFKDLVMEPSPEVAALNRHIDCPVSYATGSYTLSVPLFSWDECGFPISLSLDYTPGIKAEDKAGLFGLGWSLGGLTGTISRQVIGRPDEDEDYYILKNDIKNYLDNADASELISLSRGIKDAYADKFYYAIDGYAGCFIISDRSIIELSGNDVVITCTEWEKYDRKTQGQEGKTPAKFSITTPEGWIYNFEAIGKSSKYTTFRQYTSLTYNDNYEVYSQWGLVSLQLPDKASTITFFPDCSYHSRSEESKLYSIPAKHTGDVSLPDLPLPENVVETTQSGFSGFSEIKASQASVSFKRSNDGLTGIITNRDGETVRRIELKFKGPEYSRRLLSSLVIYSGDEILDSRKFIYHDDSYSSERPWACADFFGYSNRNKPEYIDTIAKATSVITPGGTKGQIGTEYDPIKGEYTIYVESPTSITESIFTNQGKLNPQRFYDFRHACSASLKEMTDANGLMTKISYEPNVATLHYGRNNDTVNVNIGIRVGKIETVDTLTLRRKVRSFKYFDPVFSLPLEDLKVSDFVSHSGVTWLETMPGSLSFTINCSQVTTLTASCRRPGMSAENTVIYYGAVEETVTGTDIERGIKTRYEFDNKLSVNSKFSINRSEDVYNRRHGNISSLYYLGYGIEGLLQTPILGNNDMNSGFCEVFGQKAPLLRVAKYECDQNGNYILREETINKYSHTERKSYQVGIYCEPLRRIVQNINGYYTCGGDEDDFSKGIAEIESFRTYLDTTIIIKHFPDKSTREIETHYIYPDRNIEKLREVFSDLAFVQPGTLHRPSGTVISCAGTTIAKYDLLSDNTSKYGTGGSNILTLPVVSRTVVNGREFTTRLSYKKFDYNLLPYRYETIGNDRATVVDYINVDNYNDSRQPLKVMRRAQPTMVYTYQADGQALASAGIDGTSLVKKYTHTPLIGYTSITTPSGNKTSYTYTGSRLTQILDRDNHPVKSYEYHLFDTDLWTHSYIRETSYLDPAGKNTVSSTQLFDSYGEQYATIAEKASAEGGDIVNFSRLDALGRPVRQYLPFLVANNYSKQELALFGDSIARALYSDPLPFTSTSYIPGSSSTTPAITIDAGSDHTDWVTKLAEKCNSTTTPRLRCYRLEMTGANTLRSNGYWPAGTLDVTEVTDADGGQVLEFTDFRGQKLLSRRVLDTGNLDTYYVYDDWGNLVLVIPPEAVSFPSVARTYNVTTYKPFLDYAYHYVYDEANRLISKKLPGAEKITYSYDADGLPAFTQDGNMRRDGKAMFTLYDKAGRVVVTGTCGSSAMAASATMQMRASYRAGELGVDSTHYVTDVSLPAAEMLSATYYDAVPAYLGVTCTLGDVLTTPVGLVTAQVDRVLGSSVRSRVYTVNFYDKFERPVFTQSTAADNSVIQTTTEYDFSGNVTKSETLNKIGFHRFIDIYLYGYDHLNRPTTVTLTHSDGSTSTTYPLISNTYDNLGRLRSNGAPGKAAATFSYDKRSALTAINSSHFIQNIYRGDGSFPSKSGRITKNDIRLTGRHLTFNYQYDHVGRLTKAASILENTSVDYTEEFDYDKNTNIIGLRRYGAKNYNSGALLDDLTLDYEGNQLRYVTDDAPDYPYEASLDFRAKAPLDTTPGASVASPFGLLGNLNPIDTVTPMQPGTPTPIGPTYTADYAYDANGNMTQDRHSSITAIKYNVLNLPQTVTYEGFTANRPVSQIVYDASGRKHIVRNGATILNKFVGDETRYLGNCIMVNDTIDRLQTPYGYLKDGKFYSYIFDYQGNVMAVVNGNDVAQTNLYYADGLPMNTSTDPTANSFKYTAI